LIPHKLGYPTLKEGAIPKGQAQVTRQSLEELIRTWRPRYLQATRKEKTLILDEFVALTGYHRKAAIRVLRKGRKPKRWDRRGPKIYTNEVKAALLEIWEVCGRICSKRLAPFLPEIVTVLEREGELKLSAETKQLLVRMSPATIDRLLQTHRPKGPRGRCTTKPGSLLKEKIPVRTFADWDNARPGFLESDLIAHCGQSVAGEYRHTLNAVDVATGWCELEVLPNRSQHAVEEALDQMRERMPFPLPGIDSDNDSAFINHNLVRYCDRVKNSFTRAREYKKNDQAHVEQRNWTAVRQLIGYERYESGEALELLRAIYADWRLYLNFFQPVRKLVAKERVGGKVRRWYDQAQTPYRRVLASPEVSEAKKERLGGIYRRLNPVALRHRIEDNLEQLWRLRE